MSSATVVPALAPAPLPEWFLPLVWHDTFLAAERAATLQKTCAHSACAAGCVREDSLCCLRQLTRRGPHCRASRRSHLHAALASRAGAARGIADAVGADALARRAELAHFTSCLDAEEYADTAALLARLDEHPPLRDAWWVEIEEAERATLSACATSSVPPWRTASPRATEDCSCVRFSMCTSSAADVEAASARAENPSPGWFRLCCLFAVATFDDHSLLWLESAEEEEAARLVSAQASGCGCRRGTRPWHRRRGFRRRASIAR